VDLWIQAHSAVDGSVDSACAPPTDPPTAP